MGEQDTGRTAALYVASAVVVAAAVVGTLLVPLAIVVVFGVVAFTALAAWKPKVVSPLLLVIAIPLMRPNVLSEQFALVATALVVLAAVVAFADDRGRATIPRPLVIVTLITLGMSVWLLVVSSMFGLGSVPDIARGIVTTSGTLAAASLVLGEPKRRRFVVRSFVWIVLAMSASYVITALIWAVIGVGSAAVATFQINTNAPATVYFPFTVTFGSTGVLGQSVPRFTGLGREPGWMALYAGSALLLWPTLYRPRVLPALILLAGLLGTTSTAGFGALVVVLVGAWLIRPNTRGDMFTRYVAVLFKLTLLAGAVYLAIYAPVLGFAAKGDVNAVSLGERSTATQAGIQSLSSSLVGGDDSGIQNSINLIAALAPFGLPFFALVTLAIFLPLRRQPGASRSLPVAVLVFITLLLSQPAAASTFAFMLIGIATLAAKDHATLTPSGASQREALLLHP